MERILVEIKKSTEKAHFVETDGRQCWIPKRWLRDDGTMRRETFDSKTADREEKQKAWVKSNKESRDFRNGLHEVKVSRQSEKSIACEVEFEDGSGTINGKRFAWFPKSQVRNGKVPGWMILSRAEEVARKLIGDKNHYSITIESIGGVGVAVNHAPEGWNR